MTTLTTVGLSEQSSLKTTLPTNWPENHQGDIRGRKQDKDPESHLQLSQVSTLKNEEPQQQRSNRVNSQLARPKIGHSIRPKGRQEGPEGWEEMEEEEEEEKEPLMLTTEKYHSRRLDQVGIPNQQELPTHPPTTTDRPVTQTHQVLPGCIIYIIDCFVLFKNVYL